jgi:hypothetical protein
MTAPRARKAATTGGEPRLLQCAGGPRTIDDGQAQVHGRERPAEWPSALPEADATRLVGRDACATANAGLN